MQNSMRNEAMDKRNAPLSDEALNEVAGGDRDQKYLGMLLWCPTCKENKVFHLFFRGTNFVPEYVCSGCNGTDYEDPH